MLQFCPTFSMLYTKPNLTYNHQETNVAFLRVRVFWRYINPSIDTYCQQQRCNPLNVLFTRASIASRGSLQQQRVSVSPSGRHAPVLCQN